MRQLKFRGQVLRKFIRQVRNGKLVQIFILDALLLLPLLFIGILLVLVLLDEVRSECVEHAAVERREGVLALSGCFGFGLRFGLVLIVVAFGFVLLVFVLVLMLVPVEIDQ